MSSEINFWQNKKMQNFDPNKKRKLLTNNLSQTRAVDNFCNTLIKILKTKYKNSECRSFLLKEINQRMIEMLHYTT